MKQPVRPKKALGQHFLTDQGVAQAIVAALRSRGPVLEVGPGTGVLTRYLLQDPALQLKVVEIDTESVRYLLEHYPRLAPNLYEADFLQMDLQRLFPDDGHFALIGNFPYNISSQIFFKVLDTRERIPEVVCMIQKEVAERWPPAPEPRPTASSRSSSRPGTTSNTSSPWARAPSCPRPKSRAPSSG